MLVLLCHPPRYLQHLKYSNLDLNKPIDIIHLPSPPLGKYLHTLHILHKLGSTQIFYLQQEMCRLGSHPDLTHQCI